MADNLDDIFETKANSGAFPLVQSSHGADRDFPALRVIAGLHKVVAAFAFLLGFLGMAFAIAIPETNIVTMFALVTWTFLTPLFLWGTGELILVILKIEQNTRNVNMLMPPRSRSQ